MSANSTVYVVIRYFYESDYSRWADLERRSCIHVNQQALLTAYRNQKAVTPAMRGMTAISINGETTYAPICAP